jgi:hypothetical protein
MILDLMEGHYPPPPEDHANRMAYWEVLSRRLTPEAAGNGDRQRGLFELLCPDLPTTLYGMLCEEYCKPLQAETQRKLAKKL